VVHLGSGAPVVPRPTWTLLPGGGLRAVVPDQAGLSEVDLHFNLNKPLPGVQAGDYNQLITYEETVLFGHAFSHSRLLLPRRSATGPNNEWIYEDAAVPAKTGDVVNYWILIIVDGAGYQQIEQTETIGGGGEATTTVGVTGTTTPRTTTTGTTRTTTSTTRRTTSPSTGPPGEVSVTESSEGAEETHE